MLSASKSVGWKLGAKPLPGGGPLPGGPLGGAPGGRGLPFPPGPRACFEGSMALMFWMSGRFAWSPCSRGGGAMGGGLSFTVPGPPLGGRGGGPAGFLKSPMLPRPTVFPPLGAGGRPLGAGGPVPLGGPGAPGGAPGGGPRGGGPLGRTGGLGPLMLALLSYWK